MSCDTAVILKDLKSKYGNNGVVPYEAKNVDNILLQCLNILSVFIVSPCPHDVASVLYAYELEKGYEGVPGTQGFDTTKIKKCSVYISKNNLEITEDSQFNAANETNKISYLQIHAVTFFIDYICDKAAFESFNLILNNQFYLAKIVKRLFDIKDLLLADAYMDFEAQEMDRTNIEQLRAKVYRKGNQIYQNYNSINNLNEQDFREKYKEQIDTIVKNPDSELKQLHNILELSRNVDIMENVKIFELVDNKDSVDVITSITKAMEEVITLDDSTSTHFAKEILEALGNVPTAVELDFRYLTAIEQLDVMEEDYFRQNSPSVDLPQFVTLTSNIISSIPNISKCLAKRVSGANDQALNRLIRRINNCTWRIKALSLIVIKEQYNNLLNYEDRVNNMTGKSPEWKTNRILTLAVYYFNLPDLKKQKKMSRNDIFDSIILCALITQQSYYEKLDRKLRVKIKKIGMTVLALNNFKEPEMKSKLKGIFEKIEPTKPKLVETEYKNRIPTHCEMNTMTEAIKDDYTKGVIGVSKFGCWPCHLELTNLPDKYNFTINGTHGRVYTNWYDNKLNSHVDTQSALEKAKNQMNLKLNDINAVAIPSDDVIVSDIDSDNDFIDPPLTGFNGIFTEFDQFRPEQTFSQFK